MSISLYWAPQTRASRAVWLLEEAGLDYQRVPIAISDPASKTDPGFLKASPMGKVPALADGNVFLSESAAIALYIADKYPEAGLAPAIDDDDRGRYLYWMIYTPGVIEPAMAEKVGGWKINPIQHGWGSFELMISTLETALREEWLLGDRFSAADVMIGSSLAFMRMFNLLPASANIDAYIERCIARPGYQTALALDAG